MKTSVIWTWSPKCSPKDLAAVRLQRKVDEILTRTFWDISKIFYSEARFDDPEKDWYTLCQISEISDRELELFRDIFFNAIVGSLKINDLENYFTLDSFLREFYEGFISKMKDRSENTPRARATEEIYDCVYPYPFNHVESIDHVDIFSPEVGLFTYGNIHSNVVKKVLLENLSERLCERVHPIKWDPLFKFKYVIRDSDEQGRMEVCIRIKPGVYFDLCREYVYDKDRFKDRLGNLNSRY